ncbi:hypothetical protein C8R47DRAFT_1078425 [Mycena vitilis]|nr:hypothetical protein C8R47DRAFT_1078425 [Mycena vitilis]
MISPPLAVTYLSPVRQFERAGVFPYSGTSNPASTAPEIITLLRPSSRRSSKYLVRDGLRYGELHPTIIWTRVRNVCSLFGSPSSIQIHFRGWIFEGPAEPRKTCFTPDFSSPPPCFSECKNDSWERMSANLREKERRKEEIPGIYVWLNLTFVDVRRRYCGNQAIKVRAVSGRSEKELGEAVERFVGDVIRGGIEACVVRK